MPKIRTAGAQELELKVSPWIKKKKITNPKTPYESPDHLPFRNLPEESHQVRIQVL